MNELRRFFTREDEGQAVVLFAIVMLTMLFAVGLAIDAGQLYSAKRTEQEAADSAAFAGAVVLYQGGSGSNAVDAAYDDAERNGYVTDEPTCATLPVTFTTGKTCVIVNYPPQTGYYIGNLTHIEVTIVRQVQTALVPAEAAFNPVRARGVAGAENLQAGYAIIALDPGNTPNAFNASPNADLHLTGGGILVNSTSATAANNSQNNASRFNVTPSTLGIDVAGGVTGSWASIGVPANTGHAQISDPFAQFPTPNQADLGLPTCTSLVMCQDGAGHQNPGVYTVNVGGAGSTDLYLNPGVYILKAGMDTSGNATVTGTGVFLFNTYSNYPGAPGATPTCGYVDLAGNTSINLTAMTTGTWQKMLVYQDPNCTNLVSIEGNAVFNSTGSFYCPSAPFVFDGNNATLTGSQLIAKTVDVQNGNITINYNGATTAQPILPRLAE
jgi:Flp pilus assembly protein TadG